MITTTIPLNHVVCSHCNGGNVLGVWENGHCPLCHGEGHILNPLIDEWRKCENPARLIELLGDKADEERLLAWDAWCEEAYRAAGGMRHDRPRWWLDNPTAGWQWKESASAIRCLWPNPNIARARVECHNCNGKPDFWITKSHIGYNCQQCKGFGTIDAPIIDPRWLSSTVIDLAKVIRGSGPNGDWPSGGDWTHSPPRPELMPILGDALLDAGCDDDEVIKHCMSDGLHVAGCWVVEAILDANRDK